MLTEQEALIFLLKTETTWELLAATLVLYPVKHVKSNHFIFYVSLMHKLHCTCTEILSGSTVHILTVHMAPCTTASRIGRYTRTYCTYSIV